MNEIDKIAGAVLLGIVTYAVLDIVYNRNIQKKIGDGVDKETLAVTKARMIVEKRAKAGAYKGKTQDEILDDYRFEVIAAEFQD